MNAAQWRSHLERVIHHLASRLNGYQVARCVTQATDAVWDMGLDKAYHDLVNAEGLTAENSENFHNAWLTVFALKLHEHPAKLPPRGKR